MVSPTPTGLSATTARAGTGDDPLEYLEDGPLAFRSPNRTLVGAGVAARLVVGERDGWAADAAAVSDALGAIERHGPDRDPASGPVAFCAFPFDRRRRATALIPKVIHGCDARGRPG